MPDGPRNRGGRPRGSKNKLTAQVAQVAAAEGISPIEVMLSAMRIAWRLSEEQGHKGLEREDGTVPVNEHLHNAVNWADRAAPYVHARLQTVAHSGSIDSKMDGELRVFFGGIKPKPVDD